VAAYAAGGAGLALAGAAPVLVIAFAGVAVAGAGRGLGDVATVTIIQAQAPDDVRGRVFAAQDGTAHAAFSVSAFTGGLLVQLTSARGAFVAAAASGIAAAVIASRARLDTGTRRPGPP
jgi:MFS family permease